MIDAETARYAIAKLNAIRSVAEETIAVVKHHTPGFSVSYWAGRRAEANGIIAAIDASIKSVDDETEPDALPEVLERRFCPHCTSMQDFIVFEDTGEHRCTKCGRYLSHGELMEG